MIGRARLGSAPGGGSDPRSTCRLLIPRGTWPGGGLLAGRGLVRLRLLGVGFLGMGFLRESKADGMP